MVVYLANRFGSSACRSVRDCHILHSSPSSEAALWWSRRAWAPQLPAARSHLLLRVQLWPRARGRSGRYFLALFELEGPLCLHSKLLNSLYKTVYLWAASNTTVNREVCYLKSNYRVLKVLQNITIKHFKYKFTWQFDIFTVFADVLKIFNAFL